jgi:hypothetical protein
MITATKPIAQDALRGSAEPLLFRSPLMSNNISQISEVFRQSTDTCWNLELQPLNETDSVNISKPSIGFEENLDLKTTYKLAGNAQRRK